MRVLITCHDLTWRAGSQLYTRDIAVALRRAGVTPVVFSPRLGAVAEEIRAGGVAVIDDLSSLGAAPDLIHGQHHPEAMAAFLRFPATPALYLCHGWLPWVEAAPRFPSVVRYVAVDELRRDRLMLENGIPEQRVRVLPNFVDLERFRPRPSPLPPRPRRAILLSNQATDHGYARAVAAACRERGVALDVHGIACGRPLEHPEEVLTAYDLAFARGRTALEAMAVGLPVVLCDVEGSGPLVTAGAFAALRAVNFGLGALRAPVEEARLVREIERYERDEAARVRDLVRRDCGLDAALGRLIEVYEEALAEGPTFHSVEHLQNCLTAASAYVRWIAPRLDLAAHSVAESAPQPDAEITAPARWLPLLRRTWRR